MATFTTLYTTTTIIDGNTGESVKIDKVQKTDTKRTFFRASVIVDGEDKNVCRTVFARLYDANKTARNYLNRNKA